MGLIKLVVGTGDFQTAALVMSPYIAKAHCVFGLRDGGGSTSTLDQGDRVMSRTAHVPGASLYQVDFLS